jgi:Phospholipase_D-nuclease N-terminal
MNAGTVVKLSFFVSICFVMLGAIMKITHLPGAEALLIIGILGNVVFIVSALNEVWTSIRIEKGEKIMWTIAFFFIGTLGPIIYILLGRKRVI